MAEAPARLREVPPGARWYRDTHPERLSAGATRELISRAGIRLVVEDLVIGCTAPFGEQSRNIARNAWLQAGYPPEVPAVILDRRCGSAQTAIEMGAGLIASGIHDVVWPGGSEHMGHVPINSPGRRSPSSTASRGRRSCGTATPSCTRARAPS